MDDITEKIQSLLSDEESMKQIQELAAMFSEGKTDSGGREPSESSEPTSDGGINPLAIMQLLGSISVQDKNCDLLMALKPHLSLEKQQKIDKAVKVLKLYNAFITMRENGLLDDLEKML